MKKLISWNVNGIRAIHRKTKYEWIKTYDADIVCIQETKAHPEQLTKAQLNIDGYYSFYESAQRRGYSGVAVFTKEKPLEVINGLGIEAFDSEGRVLEVIYDDFTLFNVYFPNGRASAERLDFKMAFYDAFLNKMNKLLEKGRKVIVCGDVNTAHKEIDLARPKENSQSSGFLPTEREWIDRFLEIGFVDSLRVFNQAADLYSWWDYKTKARDRNIGWRIDYFYVSENMRDEMTNASIHSEVMGSDHCPIELVLK
ncbi:MAG TPA: exodeoxyribonuclease III [Thermotogota bacterium]|nr:exodeoxyribonuclease III [Thermotogota bacterium]HPJ89564.1 exodeoxyribonuclease III [Thermotogota bacterium]HPR95751.1 exodeoxyribonuclease III [Thermotogota bacterium]